MKRQEQSSTQSPIPMLVLTVSGGYPADLSDASFLRRLGIDREIVFGSLHLHSGQLGIIGMELADFHAFLETVRAEIREKVLGRYIFEDGAVDTAFEPQIRCRVIKLGRNRE